MQTVFKRYELKFLLTPQQKKAVLAAMREHMQLDQYGRTTIRNLYFDTDSYRLIRRSLERPAYKEKLRIRSYRPTAEDEPVFVELKKKYQDVVYKRRILLRQSSAIECLSKGIDLPLESQIADEINYFRRYYQPLAPKVFLSYEREAYYATEGSELRVTMDENILYRREALSLGAPVYGTPLLARGGTLMEIKTPEAIPLWLTQCLSREKIFKTTFSKYGTAYRDMLLRRGKGEISNVG